MKRRLRNFLEPIAKRTRSHKPILVTGLKYKKRDKKYTLDICYKN